MLAKLKINVNLNHFGRILKKKCIFMVFHWYYPQNCASENHFLIIFSNFFLQEPKSILQSLLFIFL